MSSGNWPSPPKPHPTDPADLSVTERVMLHAQLTPCRRNIAIRRILISVRMLMLLCVGWALLPTVASAEGTEIRIRVDYTAYRIRPQPRATRSHVNFTFTLAQDRSIKQAFSEPGRHKREGRSDTTLGKTFRVVDQNTLQRKIERKDRTQTITINVTGKDCRATMTIEPKPGFAEWEGNSTELGTKGYYRDWKMTNSTCTIR